MTTGLRNELVALAVVVVGHMELGVTTNMSWSVSPHPVTFMSTASVIRGTFVACGGMREGSPFTTLGPETQSQAFPTECQHSAPTNEQPRGEPAGPLPAQSPVQGRLFGPRPSLNEFLASPVASLEPVWGWPGEGHTCRV